MRESHDDEFWIVINGYSWALRYWLNFEENGHGRLNLGDPISHLWYQISDKAGGYLEQPPEVIDEGVVTGGNIKFITGGRVMDISLRRSPKDTAAE